MTNLGTTGTGQGKRHLKGIQCRNSDTQIRFVGPEESSIRYCDGMRARK